MRSAMTRITRHGPLFTTTRNAVVIVCDKFTIAASPSDDYFLWRQVKWIKIRRNQPSPSSLCINRTESDKILCVLICECVKVKWPRTLFASSQSHAVRYDSPIALPRCPNHYDEMIFLCIFAIPLFVSDMAIIVLLLPSLETRRLL